MTGQRITDMTVSSLPGLEGGFVPFAVTDPATGLNPYISYRVDLSAALVVSVKTYGAIGDGANDDSAAFQEAIDTGFSVFVPRCEANYRANNLTMANDYQALIGEGPIEIAKNANGPLLTVSGRGCLLSNLYVNGVSSSYTGNNLNVSGPDCMVQGCSSVSAAGRALYITGSTCVVAGGIYITTDATGTGYDIEVNGSGAIYTSIWGVKTTQATGGLKIDAAGALSILGNQFGKLSVVNGGGGFIVANRFVGAVSIVASNNTFDNNGCAAGVTVGDGSTALTGINFGPGNIMSGATTFTLSALVTASSFHLGQVQSNNVTLTLNATSYVNNDIWHSAIAYTPAIQAAGGSPTVGDGAIAGRYFSNGRLLTVTVLLNLGTTTDLGTGALSFTTPFDAGALGLIGSAVFIDGGTQVPGSALAVAGSNDATVTFADAITPANGDALTFQVSGSK